MAAQERRRNPYNQYRRRPVRSGGGTRFLIMLSVVAAAIFSVAIFFRVDTVEVRGNSVYDGAAVISASGLQEGDNLLAVNKVAVAGRIRALLPYVEQVRVARKLPGTVVLEIEESDAVFSVKADSGQNWLMSFTGKLLEQVTADVAESHPALLGFTVTAPEVGAMAVSENGDNLTAVLILLEQLEGTGLVEHIASVDAAKAYGLVMWYEDQYEIRLGSSEQMQYKIQYLLAVLEELTQYKTGTIDLTFEQEKVARFIPW